MSCGHRWSDGEYPVFETRVCNDCGEFAVSVELQELRRQNSELRAQIIKSAEAMQQLEDNEELMRRNAILSEERIHAFRRGAEAMRKLVIDSWPTGKMPWWVYMDITEIKIPSEPK